MFFFKFNFLLVLTTQIVNLSKNEIVIKSNKKNSNEKSFTNLIVNSNNNKNSLIDATTAMFYHVENTKKCGNNLQIFNIDLEPLWDYRLKSQIKKTIRLANSLNYILNNEENSEPPNNNNKNSRKTHEDLIVYLTESNFLSSLSYFIFSQTNSESISPFKFHLPKEELVEEVNASKSTTQKHNRNVDPYILGYGVILFQNDNDNTFQKPKCLYIEKDNANMIGNFKTNKSCLSINYNLDTQEINNVNKVNNNNKNIDANTKKQIKKRFTNYLNDINEDVTPLNQNCFNWFENLKESYENFIGKSSFYRDHLNLMNYLFLEKLLENKNFTSFPNSPLWCGPYYECSTDKNENNWILIYSLPIFDKNKKIKGAVIVKLRITNMDVNQCEKGDPVFYNTHKCKSNSNCVFKPSNMFKSGSYKCKCSSSSINSHGTLSSYNGQNIEEQYWLMKSMKNNSYVDNFNCFPCTGKECCKLDTSLIDKQLISMSDEETVKDFLSQSNLFWNCRNYNITLRYSMLIVQFICISIAIALAVVVFLSRKKKIIKHSMWILLEMILFGAVLLYLTLIVQYMEPTTNTCIAIPWFRELGFTIVYGILNLRLYKILVEFQSRKAHCVQLKDKDILRLLFFIVVCVLGYLLAWTLADLDYASDGFSLVTNTSLKGLIQYPICKIKWWDYFIEIAEFLFICVGFYLLYCTRTAPSEFNERKFISLVIYFEGVVSTLLNIVKHSIYSSIHPDTILILYFFRCHTTITVMLLFIFAPKLCFLFKPNSEEYCRNSRLSTVEGHDTVASPDSVKFHGINNTDFEIGELNLIDMEPDEIRSELKRLYTELHVFRTKSAKTDNPHIQSKSRRNKKNRRISVTLTQKFQNKENESYQIRTPDESICSNDMNASHAQ